MADLITLAPMVSAIAACISATMAFLAIVWNRRTQVVSRRSLIFKRMLEEPSDTYLQLVRAGTWEGWREHSRAIQTLRKDRNPADDVLEAVSRACSAFKEMERSAALQLMGNAEAYALDATRRSQSGIQKFFQPPADAKVDQLFEHVRSSFVDKIVDYYSTFWCTSVAPTVAEFEAHDARIRDLIRAHHVATCALLLDFDPVLGAQQRVQSLQANISSGVVYRGDSRGFPLLGHSHPKPTIGRIQ